MNIIDWQETNMNTWKFLNSIKFEVTDFGIEMLILLKATWTKHIVSQMDPVILHIYYTPSLEDQLGDVVCYNVTWSLWRLNSPATRVFIQSFVQA